ncbi:MAG: ProQ/FINO family protein [Gammaproteobacteria bacterium]|nr:ProQ/FINO family protein [Gammaproteobacteria bacterium]
MKDVNNGSAFSSFKDLQVLKEALKKPFQPAKSKHQATFEAAKKVLQQLKKLHPLAFNVKQPLPLALGVAKELAKNLPELAAPALRFALAIWTKQEIYLEAVIAGGDRYSLNGSASGLVQNSEKEYSQLMLDRKRTKKGANIPAFWVYILECSNGAFYTGYTNDLEKRYRDHCEGNGAKYTRSFRPVRIAQKWQVSSQSLAMQIEAKIKKIPLKNKKSLIDNPQLFESLISEALV